MSCLHPTQSFTAKKKVHPCYDLLQITPPFFTDQLHKKHATTFMVPILLVQIYSNCIDHDNSKCTDADNLAFTN